MTIPLVSVIVPTYNGLSRGYLREALASVLAQTHRRFELIIVDDGSQDDIAAGCADILKDERVRLARRENGGLSAARMTGIALARGEYIALLDDDDRWSATKLEAQVRFLAGHPDPRAGMVFTGVRLIDGQGRVVGARVKRACGGMYRSFVLKGNGVTAPSAVLLRKAVVDDVGNFDPAMRSLEDLDMWLRVARKYHIYSMPELLTDYRMHGNTITAKSFDREEKFEKKLYDRVLNEGPGFDRRVVLCNMYRRFAIRHFSLGNYVLARRALERSMGERPSAAAGALWVMTFLPAGILAAMKTLRQRIRMLVVQ